VVEKFIELIEYIFHLKLARYLKRNICRPNLGDYIFDVGANKGSMTKLYLRLYKKINIIAFEPLSVFEFKSDQVKLIKAALGAETGSAKFYVCKHNASSSLIPPNLSSDWLGRKAKILGLEAKNFIMKLKYQLAR
jgi:hypothetical protein